MERGGTEEKGPDETGKVVRIPTDWFGPPDELVPFGPRAAEADTEGSEPAPGGPAAPVDPNSFWDECSNSIQDVVEAPGVRGVPPGCAQGLFVRVYEVVRDTVGVREAVAGVVIALIVGLSVVGWLAGQSPQRPARSVAAAVSGISADSGDQSRPLRWIEGLAIRHAPVRSSVKATHRRHTELPTRHSQTVEVVYHPSQTQSVPSPMTDHVSSATGSSLTGASSGAKEASAGAAPPQSPPTAFGANSALGPINSPDG